jgi:hypothetical protein
MAMAKARERLRWFVQEGIFELARAYWPIVLAVLTPVGQYFYQVPWPYFFTAFAVTVFAAIWGVIGLAKWRKDRKLQNKVVVTVASIFQGVMDSSTDCRYHLNFRVQNGSDEAVYMEVGEAKWTLDGKAITSVDIFPAQGMLAPRSEITLASPCIDRPSSHLKTLGGGDFQIEVKFGYDFNKPVIRLVERGTFEILADTNGPMNATLPAAPKVTSITVEPID